MSIVRVGSTQKFADNWDNIFGGKKPAAGAAKKAGAKSAKKKKADGKPAKKKKK